MAWRATASSGASTTSGVPVARPSSRCRSTARPPSPRRDARPQRAAARRARARWPRAELAATLESTADGLLVTDLSGRIRHCNRRFADLWALPRICSRSADDARIRLDAPQRDRPAGYARRPRRHRRATLCRRATCRAALRAACSNASCSRSAAAADRSGVSGRSATSPTHRRQPAHRDAGHTDALTGLPNRRALVAERVDARAIALAARGRPFALLLSTSTTSRSTTPSASLRRPRVGRDRRAPRSAGVRQIDSVARLAATSSCCWCTRRRRRRRSRRASRDGRAAAPFTLDGLNFTVTASVGIALHPPTAPTSTSCCGTPMRRCARSRRGRAAGASLPAATTPAT